MIMLSFEHLKNLVNCGEYLDKLAETIRQGLVNKGKEQRFTIWCSERFWDELKDGIQPKPEKRQTKPYYRKERW